MAVNTYRRPSLISVSVSIFSSTSLVLCHGHVHRTVLCLLAVGFWEDWATPNTEKHSESGTNPGAAGDRHLCTGSPAAGR